MALPPSLEWTLRQACVGVGGSSVLPDHLGKVHHVGDGALTREWTFGLVAAVAGWRGGLAVGLNSPNPDVRCWEAILNACNK